MNLHDDRKAFQALAASTAQYMGIGDVGLIEKDYVVSLFLERIAALQPEIVFKGGTSLSKCYKVIRRFSEDIDLSMETDRAGMTEGRRRRLKQDVVSIIDGCGFTLVNPEQIRSRRDFNRYIVDYKPVGVYPFLKQNLIIETSLSIKAFPVQSMSASSLIHDFLSSNGGNEEIEQYGLRPFTIRVLSLERTFIDKVFAVVDYYIDGNAETHSRHIYDLFKLYPRIKFNSAFREMAARVREERKPHTYCRSAQDGVDISRLLSEIISGEFYKSDYNTITRTLLFEPVAYSDSISVLQKIITDRCFVNQGIK